jgi:predicted DNA-binding transcriptional regulator AlpA
MRKHIRYIEELRLREDQVERRTKIKKTKRNDLIAAGLFPPQRQYENSTDVYWLLSEIMAYVHGEWFPGWEPAWKRTENAGLEAGHQAQYTFFHIEYNFNFPQRERVNYISEMVSWVKDVSRTPAIINIYRYPQFLKARLVAANKVVNDFCMQWISGVKFLDQNAFVRIPLAFVLFMPMIVDHYNSLLNSILIG